MTVKHEKHGASQPPPPQTHNFTHKVPTEIMIHIFTEACHNSSLTNEAGPGPTPLIISSVCRSWRDIALDTPILWSSIEFHYGGPGHCRPKWTHEALKSTIKRYLERSRQLPLFIAGNLSDEKSDEPLLDELVRHAGRWRELHLFLDPFLLPKLDKVNLRDAGGVPLLEALSLDTMHRRQRWGRWDEFTLDGFESAPVLTSLTLFDKPWNIRVPWEQITHFTSNQTTLEDGLENAQRCRNLSTLTLGGCGDDIPTPITLPSVHSLHLVASMSLGTDINLSGIFLNVTLPRLTSLAIDNYEVETGLNWPHENVLGALARNSQPSSLTTLSIRNVLIDYTQLIECLELLPALETLSVIDFIRWPEMTLKLFHTSPLEEGPRIFPEVVKALIWRVDCRAATMSPQLAPNLKRLTLGGKFNHSDALLVDMIESRCRVPSPPEVAKLNYVCLEFHRCFMKDSARKRIRRFKGMDGLEIRVIENSWSMSV